MKAIFKSNLSFFIPYTVFLFFGAILISINTKAATHLEINTFHNHFFDIFFYYTTFLGDGVTALLIVIALLALSYRYVLIVGFSNITSALFTQFLKRIVFADVVRPKKFFEGIQNLYLVPGVENYSFNSFPSGHATCAFALYLSLALIVKKKRYQLLFFIIAFIVGFSRIYLSQHFFEDVYVGSLIGVIFTLITFYNIQKIDKEWIDKSLISFFKQ
jgi:membrane-associated phospholipid phosphatase